MVTSFEDIVTLKLQVNRKLVLVVVPVEPTATIRIDTFTDLLQKSQLVLVFSDIIIYLTSFPHLLLPVCPPQPSRHPTLPSFLPSLPS